MIPPNVWSFLLMGWEELQVVGGIVVCSACAFAGSEVSRQLNSETDKESAVNTKSS
ncbi:hypothetical protein [Candidatus Mycoplasma haematohominis]|uniref:Uncharacterized protein n=1 Tax=Candidatus Mycoplasma haematohominis TaxID=1494318 RepID=A0A478FR20_9MOLU|nr:hypothetical protein [Candidatus Mycoplasma haemohominis]GCE63424.1 hypothetical protein MHSWG343_04210 [Candidatus Mycoplasma haemohominis]